MKYKLIGIILILLSLCCLILAIGDSIVKMKLIKHGVITQGTVTSYDTTRNGRDFYYQAHFEYYDQKGVKLNFIDPLQTRQPSYELGTSREIIYLPKEPEVIAIYALFDMLFLSVVSGMCFIGFGFLAAILMLNSSENIKRMFANKTR